MTAKLSDLEHDLEDTADSPAGRAAIFGAIKWLWGWAIGRLIYTLTFFVFAFALFFALVILLSLPDMAARGSLPLFLALLPAATGAWFFHRALARRIGHGRDDILGMALDLPLSDSMIPVGPLDATQRAALLEKVIAIRHEVLDEGLSQIQRWPRPSTTPSWRG